MLGAFLGFFSIAWAAYNRENQGWPRLVRASAVAMSVFAGFYVVFWLATGFDPIATFRTALKMQKFILVDELLGPYSRPWPRTVPWDIYDVILGTGWISAWLIACYFISAPKAPPPQPDDAAEQPQSNRSVKVPQRVLCMICLLQPITIAAFHVLPGEAARLYAFMFPLVLVPVGLEISTWPPKYRAAVCACLWILGAAILRNMAFL
jgi:hypothetical protein